MEITRNRFRLFCFLFFSGYCIPLFHAISVHQEIRYVSEEASEVYIVWGVNGWNLPAEKLPEGAFIRDKLVYTPMTRVGQEFYAIIDVPQHTVIDYVFWITKGLR